MERLPDFLKSLLHALGDLSENLFDGVSEFSIFLATATLVPFWLAFDGMEPGGLTRYSLAALSIIVLAALLYPRFVMSLILVYLFSVAAVFFD